MKISSIFVDHLHVEGWQVTGLAGLRWKTEHKNNNSLLAVRKPPAGRRLSENPSPPCLSLIGDTLQANSVPLGSSRERLHQIPFLPPAGGHSGSALPPNSNSSSFQGQVGEGSVGKDPRAASASC